MNKLLKEAIASVLPALSIFVLVLGLYGLLYAFDNKYTAGAPFGKDGVFEFTEAELASGRPLLLIDGWELYPDQQYSPKDFAASVVPPPPMHTFIGQYPNFSYFSAGHSPFGEVTYRLLLRHAGEPRILALEIPEIFTDYTLWVDGKQAATHGSGGSFTFLLDGKAELVLHAENHTHYYSGLTYAPALGTPETMERMLFRRMAFYGVLAVCTLTLAIFSSVLWVNRKRDSLFLHFGLLCGCFFVTCLHPFILRAGLTGAMWGMPSRTRRGLQCCSLRRQSAPISPGLRQALGIGGCCAPLWQGFAPFVLFLFCILYHLSVMQSTFMDNYWNCASCFAGGTSVSAQQRGCVKGRSEGHLSLWRERYWVRGSLQTLQTMGALSQSTPAGRPSMQDFCWCWYSAD